MTEIKDFFLFILFNISAIDMFMVLLCCNILDMCLGISVSIKLKNKLLSNTMRLGIVKNFTPSFLPSIIATTGQFSGNFILMQSISVFLFIVLMLFNLQSIIANYSMLGFKIPKILANIVASEIENKLKRK